jgi:hypothetical protein
MQAGAWHGDCSIQCWIANRRISRVARALVTGDILDGKVEPTEPERSIMAPRTRKEADVASSPNPPNMDALDASIAEPADDTMEDLDVSLEEDTKGEIGGEVRYRMISEAAYQLYAERGYVDGLELDDWLQAEAEVDRRLGGQRAAH